MKKLKVLIACEESQEVWADIPGFERVYQVSNLGNVRSLDRTIYNVHGKKLKLKGRVLKQGTSCGYKFVNLGNGHSIKVHVLVALVFLGERPKRMDICHKNGKKDDNRVMNLRYDTRSQNNLDGYKIRGYVNRKQKLTLNEVREIKDKITQGYSQRQLSQEYNVCKLTIVAINKGDLYAWVE